VEGSVFSGSLSSPHGGLPLLGCLFAWTLVHAPLFLFLSLAWVLSFYKVWQGFIKKTIPKKFQIYFSDSQNYTYVPMIQGGTS
jgi:hypothetical protein